MTKNLNVIQNTLYIDGNPERTTICFLREDKRGLALLDDDVAKVARDYPLPVHIFPNGTGFAINFNKVIEFGALVADPGTQVGRLILSDENYPTAASRIFTRAQLQNNPDPPVSFVVFKTSHVLFLPVPLDVLQGLKAQQQPAKTEAPQDKVGARPKARRRASPPPVAP